MTDLGSRADVLALWQGIGFTMAPAEGDPGRWLGRNSVLTVEVSGDPVTRVSLMVPVAGASGIAIGRFLRSYVDERAIRWASDQLGRWSKKPGRAMDVGQTFGARRVRLQSMVPMVIATVEAGQ